MFAKLKNFLTQRDGLAAVEFAVVAPFLLTLLLGVTEVSRLIIIHQKIEKIAYTVADVVAQSKILTSATMDQVLAATQDMMNPYAFGDDGIVHVTSVTQDPGDYPRVNWRVTGGGNLSGTSSPLGGVGMVATLPGGFTMNDRENIVIAEVYYRFTPMFAGYILGSTTLYKSAIYKPRLGALTNAPS